MTYLVPNFNSEVAAALPSDLRKPSEPVKSRHFGVFPCLPLDLPSEDSRLDRLLVAFGALVCCDAHKQQWMDWILSGRFGQDFPAALERLVVELAVQHGEVAP